MLGDLEARNQRRITLRKQLDDAVRGEQYELAATLRDQIAKLSELGILPPSPPPSDPPGHRPGSPGPTPHG